MTESKKAQEIIIDRFGVKRHKCECGEIAYVRSGDKSVCFDCPERQGDFKRGYAFSNDGFKIIPLEVKYGNNTTQL